MKTRALWLGAFLVACGGGDGTSVVDTDDGGTTAPPPTGGGPAEPIPEIPVEITPESPGTEDPLRAEFDELDREDDVINYRISWTRDGEQMANLVNTPVIGAPFTRKGQVWQVELRAVGLREEGPLSSDSVTIVDTPPVVRNGRIGPSTPRRGAELFILDLNTFDPDDEEVTVEISWFAGGAQVATGDQWVVDEPRGTEVYARIVPTADGVQGAAYTTPTITIEDSPPEVRGGAVVPNPPRVGDELSVIDLELFDADGDEVTVAISWRANNTTVASGDTYVVNRPAGSLIQAQVVPSSNGLTGNVWRSDAVEVADTPPEVVSAALQARRSGSVISTDDARYGDELRVAPLQTFDADGQFVSTSVSWVVDGVQVATGPVWVITASAGSQVVAQIVPQAGGINGEMFTTAPVTVRNTAPSAPVAGMQPSVPRVGQSTPLRCIVAEQAQDPDNDPLTYTVVWRRDGEVYASATTDHEGDTVPSSALFAGEVWTCELTVSDGIDEVSAPPLARDVEPASGRRISVADDVSCALRGDDTIACWGRGSTRAATPPAGAFVEIGIGLDYGLGLRESGEIVRWGTASQPSSVPSGAFRRVSAGRSHACAVRDDRTVACFGRNDFQQSSPPSGTFRTVSAGNEHTCGLRMNGEIACWGRSLAALGLLDAPSGTFVQLSAGSQHTCAVDEDSQVVCWGAGAATTASIPNDLFLRVDSGRNVSCGILLSNGNVRCWGDNTAGKATQPTGAFTEVSAAIGGDHTCGLTGDGGVRCWGSDTFGQRSPSTSTVDDVALGATFGCAIDAFGELECWGTLPDACDALPAGPHLAVRARGDALCVLSPSGALDCCGSTAAVVGTDTLLGDVALGAQHGCGVDVVTGQAVCWGNDGAGQASPPSDVLSAISAGGDATCGLRLDGTLACWGDLSIAGNPPSSNNLGVQVGVGRACVVWNNGTGQCWPMPGAGSTPSGPWDLIAPGQAHTCGIRGNGTINCWGSDQLGRATPPSGTFDHLVCGVEGCCAIDTSLRRWCWGMRASQPF